MHRKLKKQLEKAACDSADGRPDLDKLVALVSESYEAAERVPAAAESGSSAHLLRAVLESMDQGVAMIDGNGVVVAHNRNVADLVGLGSDTDVSGRTAEEIIRAQVATGEFGDGDPDEVAAGAAARFMRPRPQTVERTRRTGDVIEMRTIPLDEGGYVLIITDVTEQKRLVDQALASKEAAEMANRMKSEFLANMSHELRTPLNAIIGFSETMSQEMFGALPGPYGEYARDIHSSGNHLLSLINDLLDLSKIEAGRHELYEQTIALHPIVKSCITIVEDRAQAAGIQIVDTSPPDGPCLWADERSVKQMLLNLLSNAVKFTPQGGEVEIGVELTPGARMRISVRDTGIGMREEDIPRALQPFVQIEGAFNRRYEGTGLGLPLVKSLAELHGGELGIESAPGEGTTATLLFPSDRVLVGTGRPEAR